MKLTAQIRKFSTKDFFNKCDQIRRKLRKTADLVTFTKEILSGKLHFLCSDWKQTATFRTHSYQKTFFQKKESSQKEY